MVRPKRMQSSTIYHNYGHTLLQLEENKSTVEITNKRYYPHTLSLAQSRQDGTFCNNVRAHNKIIYSATGS
ncbi:hypothetical protein VTN02DRAFT_4007 [Thermoascus thermophilus]